MTSSSIFMLIFVFFPQASYEVPQPSQPVSLEWSPGQIYHQAGSRKSHCIGGLPKALRFLQGTCNSPVDQLFHQPHQLLFLLKHPHQQLLHLFHLHQHLIPQQHHQHALITCASTKLQWFKNKRSKHPKSSQINIPTRYAPSLETLTTTNIMSKCFKKSSLILTLHIFVSVQSPIFKILSSGARSNIWSLVTAYM